MKIVVNMNALDKQMFSFNHSKIVDPKNTFFEKSFEHKKRTSSIYFIFSQLFSIFCFFEFSWKEMEK